MAVIELTEPSAAVQQTQIYNQNIGGTLNRRVTFTVPGGIHWCVIGCVVADVATPSDVPTLVNAITALDQVTSVNGDQFWGQVPAAIEAGGMQAVLHVTSRMSMSIGTAGDTFFQSIDAHASVTPPAGKKWCVFVLRLPAALDAAGITALEAAVTAINGITLCEHLIDGTVSSRVAEAATLVINAHLRIDSIPVG